MLKKGYFQQNSGITLSQSTRSERLSSKSVADLKPESIHIHCLPIYRIYVNIFNTWYALQHHACYALPDVFARLMHYPILRFAIR